MLVDEGQVSIGTALRAQRVASASGEVHAEEAVQFAKEMASMSGAQQQHIVRQREKNPATPGGRRN